MLRHNLAKPKISHWKKGKFSTEKLKWLMKTFVISLTGDINLYFSHKHIHEQIIFFPQFRKFCCCCCCFCMCAFSYLSLAIVLSFIARFRLMLCFFDLPCVLLARERECVYVCCTELFIKLYDKMRAAPNKPAKNLNKRQNHKNQCIWFKRAPKENFFLAFLPRMRLYCFTSARK